MSQLDPHNKPKIAVEETKQDAQHKVKQNYMGSLRLQRGHKWFKVNTETHEISEVVYDSQDVKYEAAMRGEIATRKKLSIEPNYRYIGALNKKNAMKHFYKHFGRKPFSDPSPDEEE